MDTLNHTDEHVDDALPRGPASAVDNDVLSALIRRVQAGDETARAELFSHAYPELRKLARARLRDGGRNTYLDTTALVHESYLRFMRAGGLQQDDRRAFFAYAAKVMRSVIVDSVRERQALQRGGDQQRVTLDTQAEAGEAGESNGDMGRHEILAVHEALAALEAAEPRLAKVVEMRYFGGYSEAEMAQALGLNERTVRRDWEKARLLLLALMRE